MIGAGRGVITGALVGTPLLGIGAAPSALGGAIIGFSSGLLMGVVFEALGLGEKIEDLKDKILEERL